MLQTSHLFNQIHGPDKSFTGRKYLLDEQSIKRITEALGLTANYACSFMKIACLDLYQDKAIMWLEISKNAKPNDLALRYLAERWSLGARKEKQPDGQSFITYIYQTEHLPDEVLDSLANEVQLKLDDVHSLFIRIDCKDNTVVLLNEEKSDQELPSGFIEHIEISGEQLYSGQTIMLDNEIPAQDSVHKPDFVELNSVSDKSKNEDNQSSVMNTATVQAETINVSAPKYATYSRSEVDSLLRQQAESITNSFNTKIAGQQKTIAELLKNKEREFKQVQDSLKIYLDESEEKLKKNHQVNQKQIEAFLDQGKHELTAESEQFKGYLNKQIMPTLKSLDGKVISIVAKYLDEQTKNRELVRKPDISLIIAGLAFLLGVVNLILLFLRH